MIRRQVTFYALAAILAALATRAGAHEFQPACLDLRETHPGVFSVRWKVPMVGDVRLPVAPEFSGVENSPTPIETRTVLGAAIDAWTLTAPSMRGQSLRIRGLERTMTDAFLRVTFLDGEVWTAQLTPRSTTVTIPAARAETQVNSDAPRKPRLLHVAAFWGMACLSAAFARRGRSLTITAATYATGIGASYVVMRAVAAWHVLW